MINQEDKELIRQELLMERYQEDREEKLMHSDLDHALTRYQDQIQEAYDIY